MKKILQFLGLIPKKEITWEEGVANLFESARRAGDPDPHFSCVSCHRRIGIYGKCDCIGERQNEE